MKKSMKVKFWGVRGSVPSPGPDTVRYGGNTSCVSIELASGQMIILDAGTGIRLLGKDIAERYDELFILLSHTHWDHIQGFPFFTPLYSSNQIIYLFPTLHGEELMNSLIEQMDGAFSPVDPRKLPSKFACITRNPLNFLHQKGINISRIPINHPGGGYGYRIDNGGRSLIYITDNELDPPYKKTTDFAEFADFCSKADFLIHDSQYIEKDMPHKHGWGHSLISQVRELALAAKVKHLVLYHHDPDRTDNELDLIQEKSQLWFDRKESGIKCTVAFEGLELNL